MRLFKNLLSTTFLILFSSLYSAQTDTLRITSYNVLNFPGSTGADRVPYFKTVLDGIDTDILIIQEILSLDGVNLFLDDVLNHDQSDLFSAAPFINGYDSDNALFFRTDKFNLISNKQIQTSLRDISEYVLTCKDEYSPEIRIYSCHLKASQGSANEQRRLTETTILRTELNNLDEGSYFFVVGDFNFYQATEEAFQELVESQIDNDGRCFDPINQTGSWHNRDEYMNIHTQSTRSNQFGGGSSGGLDDRFDFIFISEGILHQNIINYIDSSYTTFGNDGQHFNLSINSGINNAIADETALALFNASDHLPVYLDFNINRNQSNVKIANTLSTFKLNQNYPNPFNPTTTISFELSQSAKIKLSLLNLLGKEICIIETGEYGEGNHSILFNGSNLSSGIYFYKLETEGFIKYKKLIILK